MEEEIFEILENYLSDAFELFGGSMIEGLSYTMHNAESMYDQRKGYAITLFAILELLDDSRVQNHMTLSQKDKDDLRYWNQKLNILVLENGIDANKLQTETKSIISAHMTHFLTFFN